MADAPYLRADDDDDENGEEPGTDNPEAPSKDAARFTEPVRVPHGADLRPDHHEAGPGDFGSTAGALVRE